MYLSNKPFPPKIEIELSSFFLFKTFLLLSNNHSLLFFNIKLSSPTWFLLDLDSRDLAENMAPHTLDPFHHHPLINSTLFLLSPCMTITSPNPPNPILNPPNP
jgi:hypothetical protein